MTQIRFVDIDGTEGIVHSDLTLRYAGRFDEEIATFIEETLARSEDSSVLASRLQSFAVELYTRFPLSALEFVDGEGSPHSDRHRFRDDVRSRRPVGRIRTRSSPSEHRF